MLLNLTSNTIVAPGVSTRRHPDTSLIRFRRDEEGAGDLPDALSRSTGESWELRNNGDSPGRWTWKGGSLRRTDKNAGKGLPHGVQLWIRFRNKE